MDSLYEKLVEKYLAGACSDAEMEQIFEWLNNSDENRKEWLKLRMVSAKSNFVRFSEPEHIACSYKEIQKEQALRERLEREITRKVTLRFMRYAASILILIGVAVGSYTYIANREHTEMIVIAVANNEPVRQVILSDNTHVWLSANSRMEYPEKFNGKERNVSVEGKAYFEVEKDIDRPFMVKTEAYTVKVLGTSFEVNSFRYKPTSDVTLVDGSVEILDDHSTSLCTLQPGQQFSFDRHSGRFSLNAVDAEVYVSWHGGKLEFDGMTFAEIAKVLERYYNVRIILDEDAIKEKRLVGSLSFQKDIQEMMKTIEVVVSIKYNIQQDTVVHIKSK